MTFGEIPSCTRARISRVHATQRSADIPRSLPVRQRTGNVRLAYAAVRGQGFLWGGRMRRCGTRTPSSQRHTTQSFRRAKKGIIADVAVGSLDYGESIVCIKPLTRVRV